MLSLKEILAIPKEQRQVLQEIIGYSLAAEMNLNVFTAQQKQILTERMKKNCEKKDALFKFEEVKTLVMDRLK